MKLNLRFVLSVGLALVSAAAQGQQAGSALLPLPTIQTPAAGGYAMPQAPAYATPQRLPVSVRAASPYQTALASHCEDCGEGVSGCAPLSEQGAACGSGYGCDSGYGGGCATGDCGGEYGGGYGDCGYGAAGCGAPGFGVSCCPGWFGSAGALVMGRSNPNRVYFSAESANPQNQTLNGWNVSNDWNAGWDFTIGRCFCGGWALSATYWGVSPMESNASVSGTFQNTVINVNNLPDLGPFTVASYFDGSPEHRLSRRDIFNNVEVNAWSAPWLMSANGGNGVRFLGGVRYFQFDETLLFGSVAGAGVQNNGGGSFSTGEFGDNGGANEAYYRIRVSNNLIGPQMGLHGRMQLLPRLGLYATPKMGIFANNVNQSQQLYTGSGISGFDLQSTKTCVSFLGSLDVGLNYYLTQSWYIYGGYRVVAVTNVATSDSQVHQFLNDFPEMSRVRSSDSIVVHGALVGIGANF